MMRRVWIALAFMGLAGCKVADPLYCDDTTPCLEAASRPFCDVNGEYPASEGVKNTCIPDPSGGPSDAGPGGADGASDASGTDGGLARCSHETPFEELALVVGVNDERQQQNPWLSHDERTMVFCDQGQGEQGELFIATRSSPTGSFDPPAPIGGIESPDHEYRGQLSDDLKTIYFDRNTVGGDYQLLVATRTSVAAEFSDISPVAGVNSALDDYEPFVTDQGLYFGSNRDDVGDLYVAPSTASGFGKPVALTAVNSEADEEMPVPSADGLALYFLARDRGPDGAAIDVWVSTRADVDAEWGEPVRLGAPINTEGNEYPGWLSDDNCRLYFTSDVGGDRDIWVATRSPD
jgi:hypothetical protein